MQEAVCEFRISTDSAWDLTVPGRLFEKIGNRFPIPRQQQVQKVEIRPSLETVQPVVDVSDQLWLLTEDETSFVRLGPRSVSVHRLPPYPGWEMYLPDIELTLSALLDLFESLTLERLGLRYINKFSIPAPTIDMEEYFDFRLELGDRLPQETNALIAGAAFSFEQDVCRLQLADTPSDSVDSASFMLDLDYWRTSPPQGSDVLAWVNVAHDRIEELFEGSIRDPLRGLFGVVDGAS